MAALGQLAERAQKIRRVALGMDDRPKKVELTGANGGPIETVGVQRIDYAAMPTAQLERIYAKVLLLAGEEGRPDIIVPPGGPPAGEDHQHSGDDAGQADQHSGDDEGATA